MSNLRTVNQLAADFKRQGIDSQAIYYILDRVKLKPEAEVPYGKGMCRFYDKDKAYEAIRKELAARKSREEAKAAAKAAATPPAVAPALAASKDVAYLIGLVEEQQETIKQLVAGNQMLFKHIEGIAHQVNALVVEWRGEAAKASGAPAMNGVDIDAVHRSVS